jgi:tetratricopeptide (TPR) repeat protein
MYKTFDYYYGRQYEKMLSFATKYEDQFGYYPLTLNKAKAYYFEGNSQLTRQYADSAIGEIKIKLREFPEDDRYYSSLGLALAFKGEYKKAIENAQKAVKLKPIKLDSWQGYSKENDLAKIYIIAGEYDLAMDKLEFLLSIPGNLSVPMLKLDPAYDKLRNIPRFKEILISEYKTKY